MTDSTEDVDAGVVSAHVRKLGRLGMSQNAVARTAGVGRGTLTRIMAGVDRRTGLPAAVAPETAAAVLGVDCSTVVVDTPWKAQAACGTESAQIIATQYGVGEPVDLFYPPDGLTAVELELVGLAARALCAGCPVRIECDEYARSNERFGTWAGRDLEGDR